MSLYLGKPASASLEKRKIAARNIIRFEVNQLPVKEREKITKEQIESSVTSQMHEVSTRWQKQYLALNPASYYKKVNCPISLFFSDSELEGILADRLALFKKSFSEGNHPYKVRIVKNADHNLIRTKLGLNQSPKSVSLDFVKSVAEEAKQKQER